MGSSNSHGLSSENKEFIKKNTSYNGKEITEFYKRFRQEFPSGKINRSQFVNSYRRSYPQRLMEATLYADHLFGGYDQDGDGLIDFKEFMVTMAIASNGSPEEKLEWAFNLYDYNNDNELSMDEIVEIIIATQRFKGEYVDGEDARTSAHAIFVNLDVNRDQRVTKQEFITGALNSETLLQRLIS